MLPKAVPAVPVHLACQPLVARAAAGRGLRHVPAACVLPPRSVPQALLQGEVHIWAPPSKSRLDLVAARKKEIQILGGVSWSESPALCGEAAPSLTVPHRLCRDSGVGPAPARDPWEGGWVSLSLSFPSPSHGDRRRQVHFILVFAH